MKCADFNKYIYEFIEEELEGEVKEEMREHIDECIECKELYTQKKATQRKFTLAFDTSYIEFNSSRSSIMDRIREQSYKSSKLRRVSNNFKSNWIAYASMAAVIAIIFIFPKISLNSLKKTTALDSTSMGFEKPKESSAEQNTSKGVNNQSKLDTAEISDNIIEYMGRGGPPVQGDKEKISSILEGMKKESVGVASPVIAYADEENVALYNDRYLILLKNDKTSKEVYSVVELKDLKLGSMQGSSVVSIEASSNGQFYIIRSAGMLDKGINQDVYLVDMFNRRSKLISLDSKNAKCSFSSSSDSLVVGNVKSKTLMLYNLKDWNEEKLILDTSNIDSISDIYLSEQKDILIKRNDDMGYLMRRNFDYKVSEVKSASNLLGFTNEGSLIFQDGAIYAEGEKELKKLKNIGIISSIVQVTKENIIFNKEDKIFTVYSIKDNKAYEFNMEKLKDITISGKIEFNSDYTLMKLDNSRIVSRSGELLSLPQELWLSEAALLKDGIAYLKFSDEMMLGKFTIYKQDTINKKKVVLYDNTK